MNNEKQLQRIIDNYNILCNYCDNIWDRVRQVYPDEIACREGCDICCELQSVNPLEAHVISSYLKKTNGAPPSGGGSGSCPFLDNRSCSIYPARPTICRTHGLILRSTEFPCRQAASCPYNFPSFHPNDIPEELAADIDLITKNLTNLNLAYCMTVGVEAGERVKLSELSKSKSKD